MLIANPIYDVVFKRLFEDQAIAKGLLSRILGEEVLELEFRPQEFSARKDRAENQLPITIYRVDFRAKIRTAEGEEKVILIELQKAKLATDIQRFRNYLGNQYSESEKVKEDDLPQSLPITTIYFLNFCLDDSFPKIIHVAREYRNAISQQRFEGKHEFIECLTHDSYIIQVPKLNDDHNTELEEALRIFDQRYVVSGDPHYLDFIEGSDGNQSDPLLVDMIRTLQKAIADPEVAKIMEVEDEMLVNEKVTQQKLEAALKREAMERAEKEIERAEKEKERAEKDRLVELLKKHGIDPDSDNA